MDDEKIPLPDPADVARAQQMRSEQRSLFESVEGDSPELSLYLERLRRLRGIRSD